MYTFVYVHDAMGNRATATETLTATTTIRYILRSAQDRLYDPLQRLTGAAYSGGYTYTFAYAYDKVGNRTAQTQTITSTLVTTYTYDAANRLTSVNGQAYTWDANGNLKNDGSKVYTYTQANRLSAITASGLAWNATYNGDGARLTQVANGTPTTYTMDLAAPLVTVLAQQDTESETQYLYGLGDSPLAGYDGATWTYLSGRDGLNSVRQETDAGGNVLTTRGFDPYGVPLNGNGSTPFGYTGEQTDSTGLVFLRARYMQPATGRFTQKDLWEGNLQQPQSLHPYLYVYDNPVNYRDPSGKYPLDPAARPREPTEEEINSIDLSAIWTKDKKPPCCWIGNLCECTIGLEPTPVAVTPDLSFNKYPTPDRYMRYWLAWEYKANPCFYRQHANCMGAAFELSHLYKPWPPDTKDKIFNEPYYNTGVGYMDVLKWSAVFREAGLSEVKPPWFGLGKVKLSTGDIGVRASKDQLFHAAIVTHNEQLCFEKESPSDPRGRYYQLRPCDKIGLPRWYRRSP